MADVGTDHGYLPVYLAQNGIARRIIATDSSAKSLETARRNAAARGVTDRIDFRVADGLAGVAAGEADTIVVAGLGGETIARIIADAPWIKECCKLILQPQTKLGELVRTLGDLGFSITDAELVSEKGRCYTVIVACS